MGRAIADGLRTAKYEIVPISRKTGFDLTNEQVTEKLSQISEFDFVVFAAGKSGVVESWKYPESFFRENILSMLTILNLLRTHPKPRIYVSSYMYGNPEYLPIDEKHSVSCNNPYAYSKRQAEEICEAYSKLYNIPIIILRPFNLYGSGMGQENLIAHILSQISGNSKISVKDLKPRRDYLHILDLAQAVTVMLAKGFHNFKIYNLGAGYSMSVEEIICKIQQLAGTRKEVLSSNEFRTNEIADCYADTSAIFHDFGWKAEVSFEMGIGELLRGPRI